MNEIAGELLLVECLNRYCMVCQKDAPEFNKLFDAIKGDADLEGRVSASFLTPMPFICKKVPISRSRISTV